MQHFPHYDSAQVRKSVETPAERLQRLVAEHAEARRAIRLRRLYEDGHITADELLELASRAPP